MKSQRNWKAVAIAGCTAVALGFGLSACTNDKNKETGKYSSTKPPAGESQDTTGKSKEMERDQTAQSPTNDVDPNRKDEGALDRRPEPVKEVAAPGLTATLVDPERKSKENTATVKVTASGIAMVDPATVNGQPKDGEGHVHYRVDGGPVIATTATKLSFRDLPPGDHRITVGLAANDHTALGTPQLITVLAGGDVAKAKHEHTEGTETALGEMETEASNEPMTPPPTDVAGTSASEAKPTVVASLVDPSKNALAHAATVTVKASGVDLVDSDTVNEQAKTGEGHIHYQVDGGPIVATPMAKLSFHELTPGRHTIVVQLVANDHTPLLEAQTLNVEVPGGSVGD